MQRFHSDGTLEANWRLQQPEGDKALRGGAVLAIDLSNWGGLQTILDQPCDPS